jgi:hypothetical protein
VSVTWAYVPVDTVQRFNFVLIILEVSMEVVFPGFCRDTVTHVSGDVVLDIWQKDIDATKCAL